MFDVGAGDAAEGPVGDVGGAGGVDHPRGRGGAGAVVGLAALGEAEDEGFGGGGVEAGGGVDDEVVLRGEAG